MACLYRHIKIKPKISIHTGYQWRRIDGLKNWQQRLFRTGINYAVRKDVSLNAGYAFAETFTYGDYPAANAFPKHRIYEDGKYHVMPQNFADMPGWKELAAIIDPVYTMLPAAWQTLILCENYGQAGAKIIIQRIRKLQQIHSMKIISIDFTPIKNM